MKTYFLSKIKIKDPQSKRITWKMVNVLRWNKCKFLIIFIIIIKKKDRV